MASSSAFGRILCMTLFALALSAQAQVYQAGDSLAGFTALDKTGAPFTFKTNATRVVIFDTPLGESSGGPQAEWFEKNRALLVVNIAALGELKRRIARSRLASKPYPLAMLEDPAAAARFPTKPEKLTVLWVDPNGVITDIGYAARGKELQDLLAAKNQGSGTK